MRKLAGLLLGLSLAGSAVSATAQSQGAGQPVAFSRIVLNLPGSSWGHVGGGLLCTTPQKALYSQDAEFLTDAKSQAAMNNLFNLAMQDDGVRTVGDPTSLFKTDDSAADIVIAGSINKLHMRACLAYGAFGPQVYKGDAEMGIEWQVYSRTSRQILARVETDGVYKPTGAVQYGDFLKFAFADAAHQLGQSQQLRSALAGGVGSRPASSQASAAVAGTLVLQGLSPTQPVSIPDAEGAVVLVRAPAGQGSAFLITADGYLLTDAHVVGESKNVVVRWPDGIENPGEVLRTDPRRDVALIKTDPRGRRPLPLRQGALQAGDTVWALGAPYGMEATVTKGVVSNPARMFNNLMYIQSDVAVTHGNSGGPLLDEHGAVVGLTDLGYRGPNGDDPVSINLFTPIGDALDFLHLKTH